MEIRSFADPTGCAVFRLADDHFGRHRRQHRGTQESL
jgi:hypothetical protein